MVRVVSWNMDHWRRRLGQESGAAWEYLRAMQADYALLQEAAPPQGVLASHRVREDGIEDEPAWGSAVVSFAGPIRKVTEAPLQRTPRSRLAVADAGKGLVLVSAYGAFDEERLLETVHGLLSDLTPQLDNSSIRGVILASDLNVSAQWLGPGPYEPHRCKVLHRLAALGLVDCISLQLPSRPTFERCPCEDVPCKHVRPQRHRDCPFPWQTDYVFVSKSLLSRLRSCSVIDSAEPAHGELGDHCPIVLELAN